MMQRCLGYETQGFGYVRMVLAGAAMSHKGSAITNKVSGTYVRTYEQQWFGCACTSIRLRIRVAIWFSAIFSVFLRRTYYFTSPETVFAAKKPHVVGSRRHLPDLL